MRWSKRRLGRGLSPVRFLGRRKMAASRWKNRLRVERLLGEAPYLQEEVEDMRYTRERSTGDAAIGGGGLEC
jgi:hypothetical protein